MGFWCGEECGRSHEEVLEAFFVEVGFVQEPRVEDLEFRQRGIQSGRNLL